MSPIAPRACLRPPFCRCPTLLFLGTACPHGSSSEDGVVRLCGERGLEPALVAAQRGGYRTPILPVVISGGALGPERHSSNQASLPDGALAAVAKCSPRPCYYRIAPGRLFSREAWQPVTLEVAEAASLKGGDMGLVVEADTVSSDVPQALLVSPLETGTEVKGGSERREAGRLGTDRAVWGLAMLRRALEEGEQGGKVVGVLLAGTRLAGIEGSTVSIDARAALLLSVLSWAQQCAAEAILNAEVKPSASAGETAVGENTVVAPAHVADSKSPTQAADAKATVAEASDGSTGAELRVGGSTETVHGGEGVLLDREQKHNTVARVVDMLEQVGHHVRVVVAPDGRLRSTIDRSLRAVSSWLEKRRRTSADREGSRLLLYDTDDEDSFRWLAAQVKLERRVARHDS